jgi:hydroxymethylbilane synthase
VTVINNKRPVIRVGSRASKLALAQTDSVIMALKDKNPGARMELVPIRTAGDSDRTSPLDSTDTVGFFTRQIEIELQDGGIDMAVHSAKDLPSKSAGGLSIGAVPPRGPVEDVWISGEGKKLKETASGSVVGTGSPRRRAMLLNMRPDLTVNPIRGNVETRIRKLRGGEYKAVILARAGLVRMGLEESITEVLLIDDFLPAPGQGTLAIQIRSDDTEVRGLVESVDDHMSHRCLDIERSLLSGLGVGCSAAVGGMATFQEGRFHLRAAILDSDGKKKVFARQDIAQDQPDELLVGDVINRLISDGGADLIAESNEQDD